MDDSAVAEQYTTEHTLLHIPTFQTCETLDDTQCDLNRYITPGSALRLCQRLATTHCNEIGMNDAFYQNTHTAWIATKLALQWERVPKAGETLTIRTTPEVFKKAQVKRIFEFIDESERTIGIADTRWAIVDTKTWKILRSAPPEYDEMAFQEEVDVSLPLDIPRGQAGEICASRTATYSICDLNKHINNTFYADIACDVLPSELLQDEAVISITLHFRREIAYGTSFEISRLEYNGAWIVQGIQDERVCFSALIRTQKHTSMEQS